MSNAVERAREISRQLNVMAVDENAIGVALSNDHPTLQQSAMRMVVGFLQAMKSKTYTDARNEKSVKLAQKMLEGLEGDDLYLPLI